MVAPVLRKLDLVLTELYQALILILLVALPSLIAIALTEEHAIILFNTEEKQVLQPARVVSGEVV